MKNPSCGLCEAGVCTGPGGSHGGVTDAVIARDVAVRKDVYDALVEWCEEKSREYREAANSKHVVEEASVDLAQALAFLEMREHLLKLAEENERRS